MRRVFEYDRDKSAANKAKHGIDFEDAQALWLDEQRLVVPSNAHVGEPRWLVIAEASGKMWTAIVTRRGDAIRIISVRRARDYEVEAYGRA